MSELKTEKALGDEGGIRDTAQCLAREVLLSRRQTQLADFTSIQMCSNIFRSWPGLAASRRGNSSTKSCVVRCQPVAEARTTYPLPNSPSADSPTARAQPAP